MIAAIAGDKPTQELTANKRKGTELWPFATGAGLSRIQLKCVRRALEILHRYETRKMSNHELLEERIPK
jgi:hypothetical protein